MKKLFLLALTSALFGTVSAQDVTLTVAAGTTDIIVTMPEGDYTVNGKAIHSTGEALTVALDGSTTAAFAKPDGAITEFAAVNQPAITGVDFTYANQLRSLDLHGNNISTIKELSVMTSQLEVLLLNDNAISGSISYSTPHWKALKVLNIADNNISSWDLSKFTGLETLIASNNNLSSITAPATLKTLWCDGNKITSLNLSSCKGLESLVANDNKLSTLTASSLTDLVDVWVNANNLKNCKLDNAAKLTTLNVADNQIENMSMSVLDKKALFMDVSSNKLHFYDLYNVSDIENYIYGGVNNFTLNDQYEQEETITFPFAGKGPENASGNNISTFISTKWYDEAGNKLSSGKTKDYVSVTSNQEFYFTKKFQGNAYASITCTKYPALELRSNMVLIYDPTGVRDLKEAGFTFNVIPGGLQMSSATPHYVRVVNLSGRLVWQGEVDWHGVQVNNLHGTYAVNGVKIAIQ
ncbi:MAG: hypothetical protein HUK00_00650 [Bacteroidaceae bacterium]|nr:hypothetical protein [Bacteroidaceae bacterium]